MNSSQEISDILQKIKNDVSGGLYKLPHSLLGLAKNDPEIWSYIEGDGAGYYYKFLALFVKYFKPKNILELGNAYGVSTVMMYSELLPEAHITSVDIFKDQRYIPESVARDRRVRMVIGDALNLNIYQGNIPEKVDFLFTDTVHFYQQVKDEYDIYKHLLADEAYILIDDIYVKDKGKLFQELPFEKWDLSSWCHHNGFGLLKYTRQAGEHGSVEFAALNSARIGFRKFYNAEHEIASGGYKKVYRLMQHAAKKYPLFAKFIRNILKPFKNLYTPHESQF